MKTLKLRLLLIIGSLTLNMAYAQSPVDSVGSGCALDFDGVSDYVDCGISNLFTPGSGNFSLGVWVNLSSSSTTGGVIVSWYRCGANPGCYSIDAAVYQLRYNVGGHIVWYVRDDNGNMNTITSLDSIKDNKWHFISGVINNTLDETKLYIDGVLSGTSSNLITSLSSGSINIPFQLGRVFRTGWGIPGEYITGTLDEVRIWNYARTQTEIQRDMCRKLTGNEPGLVGYWRFDDCGGSIATDASGNGNNGTLH